MTRKSFTSRIVEAPEKAPVTAWLIFGVLFSLWTWREVLHIKAGLPLEVKHMTADGALLLVVMCAAPGFMRYWARNAGIAIDLYRRFRAAKESKTEGDR